MPELPEVETIARSLRDLVGRQVVAVEVRWARTVAEPDVSTFAAGLTGRRIAAVGRRAKWLLLTLDDGAVLLIHLRMSGQLALEPGGRPVDPHTRVLLELDDGRRLSFVDSRKFGRMLLNADPAAQLDELGPEPLGDGFTVEWLAEALAQRRTRLKSLLLEQRFLAGLGNIYTDESLWRAQLHPLRPANSLNGAEVARLHAAIRQVLAEAVGREGTTLDDRGFVGLYGQAGSFAEELAVYGRTGQPCPRCGQPITRLVVGGRGTHICDQCQE